MASLLVVDDEQSMRELLEILLTSAGHEVAVEADAPPICASAAARASTSSRR